VKTENIQTKGRIADLTEKNKELFADIKTQKEQNLAFQAF
jgi:hypothetical protein